MARRSVIAAVALVTASFAAPALPATAAHVVACVDAAGPMRLSSGLFLPGTGPAQTVDIVTFPFGLTCGFVAWSGHMHGWYGSASGTMTADDGVTTHTGSIVWAGSVITVTGDIVGTLHVAPDPTSPADSPGGQDELIATGALAPTGVAVAFTGAIVSSSVAGGVPTEEATGTCAFAGAPTVAGNIVFAFEGAAVAHSRTVSQPELTAVKCTLISPAQGLPGERPTLTASFEVACPGGACAAGGVTPEWPLRPVTICVSGQAVFGPNPVVSRSIPNACA